MNSRSRSKGRYLLATIAVLVAGLSPQLASPAAHAQQDGQAGLAVSPPVFEADASPGQTITQKFSISNLSDVERTVAVGVENFRPQGEEGAAELSTEESSFSIIPWTKISPQRVTIKPRTEGSFTATITVPANPGPGGHFGALVFNPAPVAGQGQVQVISSVSALVLLRTPGTASEKLSIVDFIAAKPDDTANKPRSFYQKGPIKFVTRIKNEGNVQVKPEISIEVRNLFGSKVATIPVDSQRVLPDSTRRFETVWQQGELLGTYSAKVTVKYGATSETLTKSTSMWGIPIGKAVMVIGGLVFFVLIVWLPRKRWKKAFKAMAASDKD